MSVSKNDQLVLDILARAAEANEPCPTNPMLMDESGLTESKVKGAIIRLEARGLIEVHSIRWSRSIYVPAIGKRTDWTHQPISAPPAKVLKAADVRRMKVVEIIQKAADAGEVMPSNYEIGAALVCADETIARDLRALARMGILVVESPGGGKRRVTLTETGATTGWAGENRTYRSKVRKAEKDHPCGQEAYAPEPLIEDASSILPCARVGCVDGVVNGGAYCATHEAAEVLAWPMVAQDLEDMAA